VDSDGAVDLAVLEAELARDPDSIALVTVMWANNEVGTIQPVHRVVELAHAAGVPVHSDAVQAFGSVPVDFKASGLDAMSVSGHKIGGPVGVGALLLGRSVKLTPVQHGGGQERDVRSGTLDTASIAAFAAAAENAVARLAPESARIAALRDRLIDGVRERVPEAVLRGAPGNGRLPGNAHFTFPGCEGDSLLFLLDLAGVESSTGSACTAGVPRPSHGPFLQGGGRGCAARRPPRCLHQGPAGRHGRPRVLHPDRRHRGPAGFERPLTLPLQQAVE
jgi:cysteine desulfurase